MNAIKSQAKTAASVIAMLLVGYALGEGVSAAKTWINTPPAYEIMNTKAHFSQSEEKVIVYATDWCPYCKKAKKYLAQNNIAFEVRDIENGSDEHKALYQSLNKPGIPQILIGDKVFTGFRQDKIEQELKQQGLI